MRVKLLSLTIALVLILAVTSAWLYSREVVAQDTLIRSEDDFGALLIHLDDLVRERRGLIVFIRLISPPPALESEGEVIQVGAEQEWFITEVGEDFVCFNRIAGGALQVRCVPFWNIAEISYLGN
jgi:hypothetical protein